MTNLLLVALGGALGSMARYKLSGLVLHQAIGWRFPIGTFTVNVLGCLIAGILASLAARNEFFSPEVRLLLFTGMLGGFTTFSAFGLETVFLLQKGEYAVAAANVLLSVTVGIAALLIGFQAMRTWS